MAPFNVSSASVVNARPATVRNASGITDDGDVTNLPASEFWKRLVLAWEARGLPTSQLGVARKLGMSQGSVQQWVRGSSLPTLATAIDIAERGKVCVEWLLTGRGPQYPDSARGDPWLESVCAILRDYPEHERARLLEFLIWQSERIHAGAAKTLDEVIDADSSGRRRRPPIGTKN